MCVLQISQLFEHLLCLEQLGDIFFNFFKVFGLLSNHFPHCSAWKENLLFNVVPELNYFLKMFLLHQFELFFDSVRLVVILSKLFDRVGKRSYRLMEVGGLSLMLGDLFLEEVQFLYHDRRQRCQWFTDIVNQFLLDLYIFAYIHTVIGLQLFFGLIFHYN